MPIPRAFRGNNERRDEPEPDPDYEYERRIEQEARHVTGQDDE